MKRDTLMLSLIMAAICCVGIAVVTAVTTVVCEVWRSDALAGFCVALIAVSIGLWLAACAIAEDGQ